MWERIVTRSVVDGRRGHKGVQAKATVAQILQITQKLGILDKLAWIVLSEGLIQKNHQNIVMTKMTLYNSFSFGEMLDAVDALEGGGTETWEPAAFWIETKERKQTRAMWDEGKEKSVGRKKLLRWGILNRLK